MFLFIFIIFVSLIKNYIMKKIVFMLVALITFSVSAQKKKNGTVYVDHPAIDLSLIHI